MIKTKTITVAKSLRILFVTLIGFVILFGNIGIKPVANALVRDNPLHSSENKTAIQESRRRVKVMLEKSKIPGFSIAIAIKSKIVWSEAFGKASLEQNAPATKDTKFRLASVSKVITAGAVARLVDSGRLNLDAPIKEYVADLPPELGNVTTRQLTGHLGGVRHYSNEDFSRENNIDFRHFDSVTDSLKIFKDDPPVNSPGTDYKYTTFGFTLVAAVVEGASKKSFLEYLEEEVFKPLKMDSSSADNPKLVIPDRTNFYAWGADNSIDHAQFLDPSYKWAGGGLLSTSEDLTRFGIAHLGKDFITPETLREMFTSQRLKDGSETGVGIGWRIKKGMFDNLIYHHEGSMSGARSAILLYPEQEIVITFLSNLGSTPLFAFETAQLLAQPFFMRNQKASLKEFKPEGIFDIKGFVNNRETTGTIEVIKTGEGYRGVMKTDSDEMPVVDLIPHPKGYQLIVASRQGGLMPVPFIKDGERLTTGKVSITAVHFNFDITKRKE